VLMIASLGSIGLTRAGGLVAYATAATCCGIAWIRTKAGRRTSRLAAVLTLIESALLLDMAFNWRWKLHQALMDFAMRKHEYSQRGLPQLIVVILLGALLLFGWLVAWRSFRGRGTTLLAVSGALLSLVLWCIEVVSLHAVDHVLYYSLDGMMAVTLLWLLSCTMTSVGILLEPQYDFGGSRGTITATEH
jgi:hypothetical protein